MNTQDVVMTITLRDETEIRTKVTRRVAASLVKQLLELHLIKVTTEDERYLDVKAEDVKSILVHLVR